MIKRPTAVVATLTLAAGLAACTSSKTSGQGNAGGPTPTTAAGLGAKLAAGANSVTSAHLDLNIKINGTTVTGSGDEKLAHGKLTALDLRETFGPNSIRIIRVDGKTYVKLPPQANTSGKPYVLVRAQSSDPAVQQLAGSMNTTLSTASIKTYNLFVRAAKSIKLHGHDTVNGAGATHYTITVDVTKLPSTTSFNKQALLASGMKTLPVDLWIDSQGRPVKLSEKLTIQGQSIDVEALVGSYNQPVTITAPPANEVSTR